MAQPPRNRRRSYAPASASQGTCENRSSVQLLLRLGSGEGPTQYMNLVSAHAALCGIFELVLSLLNLGFLVKWRPQLSGLTLERSAS